MGNEASVSSSQHSLEEIIYSNILKSYQMYQPKNYQFIKNLSHGGKLTLFKKKQQSKSQISDQQKSLIALNYQTVFKPRSSLQIDSFKGLIAYYNKRMQLCAEELQQSPQRQSNIINLLHFSIKNQTSNQVIYPFNNQTQNNKVIKKSFASLASCGFKDIFQKQEKERSIKGTKRNMYSIGFLQEFYEDSLQKQVKYRSDNEQFFREKQIWSIVYCCCKAAQKMIQNGFKEPVLSPSAIFITEECQIKVGEWQFINYYFSSQQSHTSSIYEEQGQTLVSNDLHITPSHQSIDNKDVLLKFYWPPQGLVEIQNILKLGQLEINDQKLSEAKNSQVFCLAMTILQMLTLKPYYQKSTYSEKQLTKLIEEAIEIRQSIGQPMSQQITDLLVEMLSWDPSQRFRFQDIINYIHQVFESNEQIFKQSTNFQGKTSRFNKICSISSHHTDRRQTGSLVTQVSVDPFFFRNPQVTKHQNLKRQQGYIKNVNFTVSLQENSQIKSSHGHILVEDETNRKKDCMEDSGVINQGMGDDYNPDHSDEQDQPLQNEKQKTWATNQYLGLTFLSPIQPDRADEGQQLDQDFSKEEVQEFPDEDIDYEEYDQNDNFYHKPMQSSKKFGLSVQKPFTLIENTSPSSQFSINHYVPMNWQHQRFYPSPNQSYSSFNTNLNTIKSLNLNILNRSNQEINMKQNIQITKIPQISKKQQELKDFNNIIKEATSPLSVKNQSKSNDTVNTFEKTTDNIFTSPNIMEIIRQFTKKQSQQTPDFQAIQLQSSNQNFYDSNFQSSKKLSFEQNPLKNYQSPLNQRPLEESSNSQFFSLSKNQVIESNKGMRQDKKQEIIREDFSKGWYEGAKKNGARNGFGTFYYKEGGKYSGYWYNNKMDGHGTLYYPDGRVAYQGQWQSDALHGKGILINQKPRTIQTNYDFRSFEECQNNQYWISYDGWFQNDQKSGYGQLLLSNNQKYVGYFKNDMVHGRGKFYKMDGTIFQGLWQNNHLVLKQ